MNEWIYIDELIDIPSYINSIHCDTRDFHCKLNESNVTAGCDKQVANLMFSKKCPKHFIINKNDIKSFLKKLESNSGGKKKWRKLTTNYPNVFLGFKIH